MRCQVCGLEYGLTHNCPGAVDLTPVETRFSSPPRGFAPLWYLGEGWAVARGDEAGIRCAARDNGAMAHGLLFFVMGPLVAYGILLVQLAMKGVPVWNRGGALGSLLIVGVMVPLQLIYFGICHLAVKWLLGGTGSYLGIIRPMFLTSFLMWIAFVPYIGMWIAGLWWEIAVLLLVFEEVHKVERLRTLGVLVTLRGIYLALQMFAPFEAP